MHIKIKMVSNTYVKVQKYHIDTFGSLYLCLLVTVVHVTILSKLFRIISTFGFVGELLKQKCKFIYKPVVYLHETNHTST